MDKNIQEAIHTILEKPSTRKDSKALNNLFKEALKLKDKAQKLKLSGEFRTRDDVTDGDLQNFKNLVSVFKSLNETWATILSSIETGRK